MFSTEGTPTGSLQREPPTGSLQRELLYGTFTGSLHWEPRWFSTKGTFTGSLQREPSLVLWRRDIYWFSTVGTFIDSVKKGLLLVLRRGNPHWFYEEGTFTCVCVCECVCVWVCVCVWLPIWRLWVSPGTRLLFYFIFIIITPLCGQPHAVFGRFISSLKDGWCCYL